MSGASVAPPMRVHAWNVHFLALPSAFLFAGVFQHEHTDMITFRHVLAEMRLCFHIPGFETETQPDDEDGDPWSRLAFSFAGLVNPPPEATTSSGYPIFVSHNDLDLPVPAPPAASSARVGRPIVRFHLVRHTACSLPAATPLASHLQAGCAQHIPQPIRCRDARYLPPKKPSPNRRFARLPLRRTLRTRGSSRSPSKRSASGSASPGKDIGPENNNANGGEEDVADMVAPPDMDIAPDFARQTVAAFRSSCLVSASQCAVSGMGESWCASPIVGPGVEACHIVSQQHYHLYPNAEDPGNNDDEAEYSPRRLRQAWQRTWSAENGILLMSHLHALFDARLLSIHPTTLRVRVFAPYNAMYNYHGREAQLPSNVDRNALRHHYEMCCIENMAAKMPQMDPPPGTDTGGWASSGSTSPLSGRKGLPRTDVRVLGTHRHDTNEAQSVQGGDGDPSKARSARGGSDRPDDGDGEAMPLLTDDDLSQTSPSRSRSTEGGRERSQSRKPKRRRTDRTTWVGEDTRHFGDQYWEGHITAENYEPFLANVNWELLRQNA